MSNLATLWTTACQASLSMEFSRQEYWSGWPFPSTGELLDTGIHPGSTALQAESLLLRYQGSPIVPSTAAAAAAKSLQSCPTLCNPIDGSPPGSPVPGILQARTQQWVAMPSSRGASQPRDRIHISASPALAGGFFTTSATWEAH